MQPADVLMVLLLMMESIAGVLTPRRNNPAGDGS